jgi:hypothetical protein
MSQEHPIQLFTEQAIQPTDTELHHQLGKDLFPIYEDILRIMSSDFEIDHEWRYYKDGKAWLLKAYLKKKTIFWLSLWESYIKVSFYFMDKNKLEIAGLPIQESVYKIFEQTKPIGKLIPLTMDINSDKQLIDLRTIIEYKKKQK